jgi:hypothetical protein
LVARRQSPEALFQEGSEIASQQSFVTPRIKKSGARAAAVFCDPPYNLRVRDIGGRGKIQHPEFAFASGEMPQYREFLSQTMGNGAHVSTAGAVH